MIEKIEFKNFKVLSDATLPLGQFTLIVGPNGSGKSTALDALRRLQAQLLGKPDSVRSFAPAMKKDGNTRQNASIAVTWSSSFGAVRVGYVENPEQGNWRDIPVRAGDESAVREFAQARHGARFFSFDPLRIMAEQQLDPAGKIQDDGYGIVSALDRLRDHHPERFEALNLELSSWLPEYDKILFDTPQGGFRKLALRIANGQHKVSASELSHGTLLVIAILTLSYLPEPPPLVAIEEPERGIHPRLFRNLQQAMNRLAFPQDFGDKRNAVQVIATTHSPYLLDLYKDHPEQVVIAEKKGAEAKFTRLMDHPNFREIVGESPLGEVWFSGVLGGVPAES